MSRLCVLCPCAMALVLVSASCFAADRILLDRLGPTQGRLFISNADGSAEHPLTPPGSLDYNPSWSAKGDWIAFTSERAGSADLYRIHPDGTGIERLTDDPAYDDQAAFSPDGQRLVFVSTRARRKGEPVGSRCRDASGQGIDFREWRRLPSLLVTGRAVDCILVGSREQFSGCERPLGATAPCGHLPDSSGWLGAEADFAAWGFLRQSQMDARRQERSWILHAGAGDLGFSLWREQRRRQADEVRYRHGERDGGGGGTRSETAAGGVVVGRDCVFAPGPYGQRGLLWERQAGPEGGRSAESVVGAGWKAGCRSAASCGSTLRNR